MSGTSNETFLRPQEVTGWEFRGQPEHRGTCDPTSCPQIQSFGCVAKIKEGSIILVDSSNDSKEGAPFC